jgi:outer membrane protein W
MRKVLCAAGIALVVSVATAQKLEVGLDGGYGFGFVTAQVGTNISYDATSTNKYEQVYASGGEGIKIRGEVDYFLSENIGIMVVSGYSMGGKYSVETRDLSPGGVENIMEGTTSYVPVNLGLKLRARVGNAVAPYIYIAPGVFFPGKTETTNSSGIESKLTYKYGMGFCFTTGVGTTFSVSDRIGIKVEFSPTSASASPDRFMDNRGITTTYKNNTPPEQLGLNEKEGQPHESFSSLAFRAGLSIKIF